MAEGAGGVESAGAAAQALIQERIRQLAALAHKKEERKQDAKAQSTKIKAELNHQTVKFSMKIVDQVNGGIGGHRHQHGLPGGRYSAKGATSARGRHRKRSKK